MAYLNYHEILYMHSGQGKVTDLSILISKKKRAAQVELEAMGYCLYHLSYKHNLVGCTESM